MIRHNLFVALVFVAAFSIIGCGGNSGITGTSEIITATSGSGQSAAIGTSFMPLVATVTDSAGSPVSGVNVTFAAPANGASATFPGGNSAVSGANGQASVMVASNTTAGSYTISASTPESTVPASFMLTNSPGQAAEILCSSGDSQSTAIDTQFATHLGVQVADSDGNAVPENGVVVTFTPPATGVSATFPNGNTSTTGVNGQASVNATANGTSGGPYQVVASANNLTGCDFDLTNTSGAPTSENFTFYVTGLEAINNRVGPNFYAVAGVFIVNSTTGQIMGGEQDYNDARGLTSPQPSGDAITGGQLTVNSATGQGTLTVITNNQRVGYPGMTAGTERFGVQFVNASHARIIQFDGSGSSSGSLDLQASTVAPSGNFSFTLTGVDPSYHSMVVGGVFDASGGTLTKGVFDVNSDTLVAPALNQPFTGAISAPDNLGRGTITATNLGGITGIVVNYYAVGSEAIRLIDVDVMDSAVGSAFGQGNSSFTNSSLAASVFGIESNSSAFSLYAATGMLSTTPATTTFAGVADYENGADIAGLASGSTISGTYSMNVGGVNGYGSLTIGNGGLGGNIPKISVLGVYMTDPNLNVNDPSNTTSGLGGALLADLDFGLIGTGVFVRQTDTATASFTGSYVFGAQTYFFTSPVGWEFDFLGQGTVINGTLKSPVLGDVSDPFNAFGGGATDNGVAFVGTAVPDGINPGRYTTPTATAFGIEPMGFAVPRGFNVVVYQANGGQLFMMDEDLGSLWLGSIEQQSATSVFPALRTTTPARGSN
jgi:hypothetical protein